MCCRLGCLNDVWVFSMDHMEWWAPDCGGELPPPRRSHVAAVAGGRLIIHGGYCDELHLCDTWVLDTASWKWQKLQEQVRGCTHAVCCLCWCCCSVQCCVAFLQCTLLQQTCLPRVVGPCNRQQMHPTLSSGCPVMMPYTLMDWSMAPCWHAIAGCSAGAPAGC
jgi:hypothetical protein